MLSHPIVTNILEEINLKVRLVRMSISDSTHYFREVGSIVHEIPINKDNSSF